MTSSGAVIPRRTVAILIAAAALTVALASCGGTPAAPRPASGGTAVFAQTQGANPDYIFPLTPFAHYTPANLVQFQALMFRPLYWFGNGGQVTLNQDLSLAEPPQYSADGTSVSITLKPWMWSDGRPLTSRDVLFWMNLLKAEKAQWPGYVPCAFPDNVTAMKADNARTVTFTIGQGPGCSSAPATYGSYFFTYNELSQIIPLPQHAWDVTGAGQTAGDNDTTPTGAVAVYGYLSQQSQDLTTYDTNPLWQVVDGPWKLARFTSGGLVAFTPNKQYSGTVKPSLSQFVEVPSTTDAGEFNALVAGTPAGGTTRAVDYGFVPADSAARRSSVSGRYAFSPWPFWEINYMPENYSNPKTGPIFKQLYFRQAFQHLVDQAGYVKSDYGGLATPTYAAVPPTPSSPLTDDVSHGNAYAYDPQQAASILTDHGWDVHRGGTTLCVLPGSGAHQCGAGIAQGAQLSFTVEFYNGPTAISRELTQLKNEAAAAAGIQLSLSGVDFQRVLSDAQPCAASSGSGCSWDFAFWGSGWSFDPDYFPVGDQIFATAATSNVGAFSDAHLDQLITSAQQSGSLSALSRYSDYVNSVLPVVWMPEPYAQLSEVNKHLQGWQPQDPLLQIYPESWYFTK